MHKQRVEHIVILASFFLMLLSGCTGLRRVVPGNHLLTGSTIKIDSTKVLLQPAATKAELKELIKIEPNRKLLWMRPLLCLHNLIKEPKKENGFWHWMKYKLGEKPALIEDLNLENLSLAMENRLQNRGYFLADAKFEVDSGRKTGSVNYKIALGKPYILKSVIYPDLAEGINGEIHNLQNESLVKVGNTYNLNDFENERIRIDSILKEKGYYYFNPDYLLFTADTSVVSGQVNVRLKLKPEMPEEASTAFRLNDIYVLDDYSLRDYSPDTTDISQYFYVSQNHMFKPQVILNSVLIEKDSLYSRKKHYNSIRNLMGIGVYKFAIARFTLDDSLPGKMKANIFLTPYKKISLSAEVSAAVKNTGFAGPGLKLSYKNKNLLGGAELFAVTLGGNFETQLKGDTKGQTSYQVTLDASLTLPKFEPFKFGRKGSNLLFPKTIITGGVGIYSRVNLYDLRSWVTSLGYSWKTSEKVSHLFRPIDISYTNLGKTTAEFEEYLQENPTVRKSFEEQFVIGSSYAFVYNNLNREGKKHGFYISEMIDLSGNLANTIANVTSKSSPDEQHVLLGVPFSQFIRIRNEERYFYSLTKTSQLGARLIIGAGIPYGNSTTMPYNKQYFTGGPSSLRAFLARSVGPGTYHVPDSASNLAIDQAGDLTLETSVEYRFDILKNFKGAFFADAGNIWLVNADPQRAGGEFNFNTFYNQLAVGAGFGLRLDFTFIILRLDAGVPLRKPWLPEDERWVIDKFNPGNSAWRNENIILNIAIGYPF